MQTRIIFFFLMALSTRAQIKNPFLTLKFDKVVVCDYESNEENDNPLVDKKGKLTSFVKKFSVLDDQTTKRLNEKLGDKKSYGNVRADCFEPHFGIVYYYKNEVTAVIKICLSCNGLESSIEIPAQKQGKVGKGNEVYYVGNGMTKSFRQFINSIVKKYQFSHQIQPHSNFDK